VGVASIKLPWPAKELSPNYRSRSHWPKTKAIAAARLAAWILTLEAKAEGKLISFTFHPPDNRHRDGDNMIASAKAYQDGIAQALKVDDKHFRPSYIFADPVPGGLIEARIGE
jgi:crossover junction endodeoxyribonuclease RusA